MNSPQFFYSYGVFDNLTKNGLLERLVKHLLDYDTESQDFDTCVIREVSSTVHESVKVPDGVDKTKFTLEVDRFAITWTSVNSMRVKYEILKKRLRHSNNEFNFMLGYMKRGIKDSRGRDWYDSNLFELVPFKIACRTFKKIIHMIPESITGRGPVPSGIGICKNMWDYNYCPTTRCRYNHNLSRTLNEASRKRKAIFREASPQKVARTGDRDKHRDKFKRRESIETE
jgi:hypothetical protein